MSSDSCASEARKRFDFFQLYDAMKLAALTYLPPVGKLLCLLVPFSGGLSFLLLVHRTTDHGTVKLR